MSRDWDGRYRDGEIPWDTGEPEPHLVEVVEAGVVTPGRVLEVGCGTGTNALWLAARGFEVFGIDIAPLAIEAAKAKPRPDGANVEFAVADFLEDPIERDPFDLVFDRGVFHVFDEAADRARFAERVAAALRKGGQWVSLMGSTEGPARDHGPPRRSARDIATAVEPSLEILSLTDTMFGADLPSPARAWVLRARTREVPAVPSTRHD